MASAPKPAQEQAQWQPLSLRRVLSHFRAGLREGRLLPTPPPAPGPLSASPPAEKAPADTAPGGILPEEKRILLFLRAIYGSSLATVQLYARYIVGLTNHARVPAPELTRQQAESFLQSFEARKAKPATCAAIVAALKSYFRHLVADGQMQHNPLALHKKYRNPGKSALAGHLAHSLSEADMRGLLQGLAAAGAHPRDSALFALLFMTGLRAEEVARLRWASLIEWQGQIFLDVHGKGAKARRVYVPAPALSALLHYRDGIPGLAPGACPPGRVAAPALGAALATLPLLGHLRDARKHLTRHGIYVLVKKWSRILLKRKDVSPHWFRHSCFTQLALKGVPLEAIKNLAGHESVETTMRYNEAAALMDSPGKVFE